MLVVSREKNEQIILHQDGKIIATIVLVDIRDNKVRIGVDAKRELEIDRKEVFDRKQGETVDAR